MTNEENQIIEQEEKLSEQELQRREKLKALQEEGKDPFDVYKAVSYTHLTLPTKRIV